ncbi:MAG: hypothetical protein ACQGVC_20890 [Myxococcota bacterium]
MTAARRRRGRAGPLAGLLLTAACVSGLSTGPASSIPAFPGATGFGSDTPGGRGGRVVAVTNTNDAGPGSLRAAIATPGPRIVVFRTGGTIVLHSTLDIAHPYITIAGQTAPGGGIQIRNDDEGSHAADSFPSIRISTHDVVIRYLRIRPGMPRPDPACAGGRRPKGRCIEPGDIDGINLTGPARDVLIDHVSASWATDEIIGAGAARDLTLQWSIFSEGLDFMLYTPGKTHDGKGMLLGNTHEVQRGHPSGRVSVHHNYWAHNSIRSPMLNPSCPDPDDSSACLVDVVNNVVYDWTSMGTHVSNSLGHAFANVVGNYYKPGPSTRPKSPGVGFRDWTKTSPGLFPGATLAVHVAGNVEEGRGQGRSLNRRECYRLGRGASGRQAVLGDCQGQERVARFDAPDVRTGDATAIVTPVLEGAGASMRLDALGRFVPARDEVDSRVVGEFRQGTGRVITRQSEVPDWPSLAAGTPPRDTDGDGMPDLWEDLHGLPVDRAGSSADTDGDGYTDVEEYLNGTDPNVVEPGPDVGS